jgi:hypothetical protein
MSKIQFTGWLLLVLLIGAVSLPAANGQATRTAPRANSQKSDRPPFPNLADGLLKTPGCLGVESANTASGKNVIFAWFEDKQSVLKWYNSSMHQGVMNKFFPDRTDREPLAGIPEDFGPILAIASITFSDQPKFEQTPLPISQIAIELYAPVSGGLSLGGRFAPDSIEIEGHVDYSESKGK